jgi:hypothetical protein
LETCVQLTHCGKRRSHASVDSDADGLKDTEDPKPADAGGKEDGWVSSGIRSDRDELEKLVEKLHDILYFTEEPENRVLNVSE